MSFLFDRVEDAQGEGNAFGVFLDGDVGDDCSVRRDRFLRRARAGRFSESAVQAILESALENTARFAQLGGLLAPGTDAGAWAVPHAVTSEYALLANLDTESGTAKLMEKF